jgi:cohesin loading factor subunit SCC2
MVQPNSVETQAHRGLVAEIFQILSSIVPRINSLIRAEFISLSDVIIIQAVYIAIGPFFIMEPAPDVKGKKINVVHNTLGNSAIKALRLDALTLIRSVGLNYPSLIFTEKSRGRFLPSTKSKDRGLSKKY